MDKDYKVKEKIGHLQVFTEIYSQVINNSRFNFIYKPAANVNKLVALWY